MGNLVFQATLGGQVNLVGPNTASTYNINVPTVNGNMVTTGDTGTVTNTMCATSVYTAPGTIGSGTPNTGAFTTLSASGVASFAAGSASAPALTRTGDTNTGMFFPAADTIAFAEGGTETMRLDSSGNMGLGVTPSAWASPFKALQGGGGSYSSYFAFQSNAYACKTGVNHYYNGSNYVYAANAAAARFDINENNYAWNIAASGTAGNAISFTQVMTLDSSGNLGIGTTSPSTQLHLYKNAVGAAQLFLQNVSSSAGSYATVQFDAGTVTSQLFSDAAAGVYAAGAVLRTVTNHPLMFGTNSTERMRIDTSGNLLVGTGGAIPSSSVAGERIGSTGYIEISRGSGTNSWNVMTFVNGNGAVGFINTNGSSTSFVTSSDYRLKEDIAPMTSALAKVSALKPVTYKWKSDGSDGEGFIAHELAEVCPHAVTGAKDAVDEEGNPKYQGIDTSFLVATLTAAIQELKAEFDAYKAAHP